MLPVLTGAFPDGIAELRKAAPSRPIARGGGFWFAVRIIAPAVLRTVPVFELLGRILLRTVFELLGQML